MKKILLLIISLFISGQVLPKTNAVQAVGQFGKKAYQALNLDKSFDRTLIGLKRKNPRAANYLAIYSAYIGYVLYRTKEQTVNYEWDRAEGRHNYWKNLTLLSAAPVLIFGAAKATLRSKHINIPLTCAGITAAWIIWKDKFAPWCMYIR
ncbi:MAG TPA: hypothetical protein QGF02_02255 [Candidatus Babeliales bacterium]|nr:hypothetical protein [Candidatus Babeliales bacterium]